MDLATLAVFRAVAREESITRAAELLGRAPSNVTTRIQQLEAEIGVALFARETRRMGLTSEGKTYLDYAERILNLADEARQQINPEDPGGTLRIGSMESTVASRLPATLAAFNRDWPKVTLELSTAPTRQLVDAVQAHRIDCALIAIAADDGWSALDALETSAVFREELVLLVPKGHRPVRAPADVEPMALAAFAPGCTYRMLAKEWLMGGSPARSHLKIQEVGSYHAMFACTAAGTCVSVMPKSVADTLSHLGSVEAHGLMTVDTHLAFRPGFATPAFLEWRKRLLAASNIEPSKSA